MHKTWRRSVRGGIRQTGIGTMLEVQICFVDTSAWAVQCKFGQDLPVSCIVRFSRAVRHDILFGSRVTSSSSLGSVSFLSSNFFRCTSFSKQRDPGPYSGSCTWLLYISSLKICYHRPIGTPPTYQNHSNRNVSDPSTDMRPLSWFWDSDQGKTRSWLITQSQGDWDGQRRDNSCSAIGSRQMQPA